MQTDFSHWAKATTDLPWGVQSVFHTTLQAVADGQIKLTYGADYSNGSPCLVNAAATMLGATNGMGGAGIPSSKFGMLVRSFDRVNRDLFNRGVNTEPNTVSPMAAEVLIHNFGTLKDKPIAAAVDEAISTEAFANNIYREASDADMTRDWLNALKKDAVCDMDLSQIIHEDKNAPSKNA